MSKNKSNAATVIELSDSTSASTPLKKQREENKSLSSKSLNGQESREESR